MTKKFKEKVILDKGEIVADADVSAYFTDPGFPFLFIAVGVEYRFLSFDRIRNPL